MVREASRGSAPPVGERELTSLPGRTFDVVVVPMRRGDEDRDRDPDGHHRQARALERLGGERGSRSPASYAGVVHAINNPPTAYGAIRCRATSRTQNGRRDAADREGGGRTASPPDAGLALRASARKRRPGVVSPAAIVEEASCLACRAEERR
jgi:hypothetical protein